MPGYILLLFFFSTNFWNKGMELACFVTLGCLSLSYTLLTFYLSGKKCDTKIKYKTSQHNRRYFRFWYARNDNIRKKKSSTVINTNITWDRKGIVVGVGAEGSFYAEADKSVERICQPDMNQEKLRKVAATFTCWYWAGGKDPGMWCRLPCALSFYFRPCLDILLVHEKTWIASRESLCNIKCHAGFQSSH